MPFDVSDRMEREHTPETDLTRSHHDMEERRRLVGEFDVEICKMVFSACFRMDTLLSLME